MLAKKKRLYKRWIKDVSLRLLFVGGMSAIFFFLLLGGKFLLEKRVNLIRPVPLSSLHPIVLGARRTSATLLPQVKTLLKKEHIVYTLVTERSDGIYVTLEEGKEAILSPTKDLSQQISSLQLMIARFTIEAERFRRIDFRFDRPVVGQ